MAMKPRPGVPGAAAGADSIEPLGKVRRSQLVSTYGIGAIVDLEKGSFMPMGLEDWESATRFPSLSINEPQLQAMLGVTHFRLAPVLEDAGAGAVKARSTAPAIRFPEWHECPKCHRIGREDNPFELTPDGRLRCIAHGFYATPVRFVVACRKGHVSDFPWEWWAHRDRQEGTCDKPELYLLSRGKSASLADLYVSCKTCKASHSMGDAFNSGSLPGKCLGIRPWLHDREPDCGEGHRALQRGASNVHFGVVCSALSIPPASEAASQIVLELTEVLEGVPDAALAAVLGGYAKKYGIAVEPLIAAWRHLRSLDGKTGALTEKVARAEEYAALSETREDITIAGIVPQFMNTVRSPPAAMSQWFDVIGAASRLREVRALAAFSRIEPYPVSAERVRQALLQGKISPLSKTARNWLPAAEIRGEGIFLRFSTSAIDAWIKANPGVVTRAGILEQKSAEIAAQRGYIRDYNVTPRLLLVHSFAHALIRQISVECGYSASSLRERLYVSEAQDDRPAMNGVLIYTGSPDSEGSLGGLVRLAEPELLTPIIERTLRSAGWCGSDPVCLETDPDQSGDRVSGAACHCCLLLPETACEKFNRELDRAILVGDADNQFKGFFGVHGDV